jgi:TetR/AcrR family transcriptional regulator, copper-responsive repressor
MEMNQKTPRARGRPRGFDSDAALDVAMRLFWTRGYEATSINELATAMAINPPSLYAAFGDKKRLFTEAIARYRSGPGSFVVAAMEGTSTARAAIERVLEKAAEVYSDPSCPAGCMVIHSATNCAAADADIVADLAAMRAATQRMFADRISLGIAAGDVPADADAVGLGSFYAAVLQGMSAQSRDGATAAHLKAIAATAMRAWPG